VIICPKEMEQAHLGRDQEQGEVLEWVVVEEEAEWEEIAQLLALVVNAYVRAVVQRYPIRQVFPVILLLVQNVAVEWFGSEQKGFFRTK
jgi:hypothetical protein